ncbi:hypothetical protein ACFPRL_25440 [Pseudoclavibacter helvolus]
MTSRPSEANAMASAPMPQPRSATLTAPACLNLFAWCAATCKRVACWRPASVKSIRSANGPNFATARRLSFDCVTTAATTAGEPPAARSFVTRASASAEDSTAGASSSSVIASGVRRARSSSRCTSLRYRRTPRGVTALQSPPHRPYTRS